MNEDLEIAVPSAVDAPPVPLPAIPENFDDARAFLFPRMRWRCEAEIARLWTELGDQTRKPMVGVPVGEHLFAELVYGDGEAGHAVVPVGSETFAHWGVTPPAALEIAVKNSEMANPLKEGDQDGHPRLRRPRDGMPDAAYLLLPDKIRMAAGEDAPIVEVGTPGEFHLRRRSGRLHLGVLFTGWIEPFQMAFRLDADGWRPCQPVRGSWYYHREKLMSDEMLDRLYRVGSSLLKSLHERKEHSPVCVSRFMHGIDFGGVPTSMTLVKKGFVSLIPRTDRVAFAEADADAQPTRVVAQASWDKVAEVLGDELQPIESYPARYRVGEFPSDEQLRRIGHA